MITDVAVLQGTKKIRTKRMEEGALWRVSLCDPDDNVLGEVMTDELTEVFLLAAKESKLKAIVLSGEGPNFSFGSSVEQHRREHAGEMLASYHALFRAMAASGVPVFAAVRGSCFGGGLGLVAFCQRVFAHPDAQLGQPEIALGVFAPVASAILADRVGRGSADDLLLSGRVVKAKEAQRIGLVDMLAKDPEARAQDYVLEHLLPRSASSIRFVTRAARCDFMLRFDRSIQELERMYLGPLMDTHDASEGIESCIAKRTPAWTNA